jgi:hypothetical protein
MITLWWKRILLKLGLKPSEDSIPINEKSVREQGRLLHLELSNYTNYSFKAVAGGLVHFKCIKPNLISLTELVIELNSVLKDNTALSMSRCYFTDEPTTINNFFERDGYYISHSKILDYCKAIKEFYTLTEVCEKATVGVHEHNNRMLTKVFSSLKDVNAGLLDVLTYKD